MKCKNNHILCCICNTFFAVEEFEEISTQDTNNFDFIVKFIEKQIFHLVGVFQYCFFFDISIWPNSIILHLCLRIFFTFIHCEKYTDIREYTVPYFWQIRACTGCICRIYGPNIRVRIGNTGYTRSPYMHQAYTEFRICPIYMYVYLFVLLKYTENKIPYTEFIKVAISSIL
jgi:hypothetical protein